MGDSSLRRRMGRHRSDHLVLVLDVLEYRHVLKRFDKGMSELSDAHALAVERSCAVTAVALSGQRREGVRLVSGARRDFGLSSTLDFIHVPYPPPMRTWTRRTLTCGVALQCSPSKDRIVGYRLNELSARELSALTLVEASVALGWIAANWPGLLPEIRRLLPDLDDARRRYGRRRNARSRSRNGAFVATADRRPAARYPAEGIHRPAGAYRQAAPDLRQNAVDDIAEATTTALLCSRRRRGRRAQPQPAATEPAAGQRLRRDARTPSRHPLSRMEFVDEDLHGGPRRSSRARHIRAATAIR